MSTGGIIAIILAVFLLIGLSCWGAPSYNVWHQHMQGKAELSRAEFNRRISVVESEAKLASARNLAQADIERAKGTAEANHIIGASLTTNYLKWYYIEGLHQQSDKTYVYIPTEAMIPILEAGRLESALPNTEEK